MSNIPVSESPVASAVEPSTVPLRAIVAPVPTMRMRVVNVLGLRFGGLRRAEAVEYCLTLCRAPRPRKARWVVPVNAGILEQIQVDPALDAACRAADLCVPDGLPVVWASRWFDDPLPERVPGIDLFADLLRAGGAHGLRVFYLGAKPDVVKRMAEVTAETFPGVVVAGYHDGYFDDRNEDQVIDLIRRSDAQLLLLGMPSPRKEVWGHANLERLGVNMVLPVGGSFDVLSGRVPRAPAWTQRIGMEWAWRVLKEPRVYAMRYLRSNTAFISLVWRETLRLRRERRTR